MYSVRYTPVASGLGGVLATVSEVHPRVLDYLLK